MLKKLMVKNWILSKIAFVSFRGRMLKSKNLKMRTRSKAQFTLTVRKVGAYIAKAIVLMGICLFYYTSDLKHSPCFGQGPGYPYNGQGGGQKRPPV